jgi:hypothetical protein
MTSQRDNRRFVVITGAVVFDQGDQMGRIFASWAMVRLG